MNTPRYDLLVISARRGMGVSPQGIRAVLMHLQANGCLAEIKQTITQDWTEIHAEPGVFAHSLFHEGESTGVAPFLEFGVRLSEGRLETGFDGIEPVRWFFEFRGAAYDHVADGFLERMDGILYCRPEVWVRPFRALRPRDEPEVEPEDPRKKRSDGSDGRIGVRIEET